MAAGRARTAAKLVRIRAAVAALRALVLVTIVALTGCASPSQHASHVSDPTAIAIEWLYWLGLGVLPIAASAWFVGAWRAARRSRHEHLPDRSHKHEREQP